MNFAQTYRPKAERCPWPVRERSRQHDGQPLMHRDSDAQRRLGAASGRELSGAIPSKEIRAAYERQTHYPQPTFREFARQWRSERKRVG